MKIQSILHRRERLSTRISLGQLYILLTVLNAFFLSGLWFLFPNIRSALVKEHEFLENLTTILYFEAFVLGLIFLSKLKDKHARKFYLIIPFLGLLAALDEISFGYRMFWFKAPLVGGVRIDSLHDVVFLLWVTVKPLLKQNLIILFVLLGVFACLLLLGLIWAIKHLQKVRVIVRQGINYLASALNRYLPLAFLLITVGYGVVSILIDLDIFINDFLKFFEELVEMNAALTLLFSSFSIRIRSKGSQ
jgi:hypothetical protein